ncbi:unnamed protein product [Prorocentrum cordatum]|uniref:Gamma-glutamylcyclotransferase n=1 Tax=Prorocentrum cordatum TaxID=2364126 RepID=A0ABN9UJD0_9DINO|nr:unnamed protein product [Polarella glacialis]
MLPRAAGAALLLAASLPALGGAARTRAVHRRAGGGAAQGHQASGAAAGAACAAGCVLPNATPAGAAGSAGEWPCGGAAGGPPEADVVRVFHYGANMACAKMALIKVTPVRAEAAYVPGQCLRFAAAEGVPTCSKEPAFGTLEPCEAGCAHGVVHDIPASQLQRIHDSEAGYKFEELHGVTTYSGQVLTGVQAYTMQSHAVHHSPSRRYAGLVFCSANASLSPGYADQLLCRLGELGHADVSCADEQFEPMKPADAPREKACGGGCNPGGSAAGFGGTPAGVPASPELPGSRCGSCRGGRGGAQGAAEATALCRWLPAALVALALATGAYGGL